MVKKISLVAILLIFFVIILSCYAQEEPLLDISMDLINNVYTLAGDDAYLSLTGGTLGDKQYLSGITETDCTDLRLAYSIKLPYKNLLYIIAGYSHMSEPAKYNMQDFGLSYGSAWNLTKGTQALAVSNVVSWTYCYAEPEEFSESAWVLDCGGAVYSVIFRESGENIISGSAMPLFLDDGETIESVIDYYKESLPLLVVTKEYSASKEL